MGHKSFIPRDKPKSWVVCIISGLIGLALGLAGFAAALLGWSLAKAFLTAAFVACWLVFAISGLICWTGMASGRYRDLEEKPWREQVW